MADLVADPALAEAETPEAPTPLAPFAQNHYPTA